MWIQNLIRKFLLRIQTKARAKSFTQAMIKAKAITESTGKKVLIVFDKGEYIVVTKQQLKKVRRNFHNKSNKGLENVADAVITKKNEQARETKEIVN